MESHGYLGSYSCGCRCDDCREAHAVYRRNRRMLPWRAMKRELRHGRRSTYVNYRCRCEPCRAANTSYERERLHDAAKKVDMSVLSVGL